MSRRWGHTLALLVVLGSVCTEASFSLHMEDFIKAVKQVEGGSPAVTPLDVLKQIRRAAGLNDPFIQHYLGAAPPAGPPLDTGLSQYLTQAVHHRVTGDGREGGVVLTPDGTTVALAPLLLGLEARFLPKSKARARARYQLALARDLGLVFGQRSGQSGRPGPDGCWDSVTAPQVFTLSHDASSLTTAQVNGGMDGLILGGSVSARAGRPLSRVLTEYYCHRLDAAGLDAAPRIISQRRRENFREMFSPRLLSRETVKTVELQRELQKLRTMNETEKKQLSAAVRSGMKEFVHQYTECPPIIPRCMWGAEPYRGTPTNLSLPLSFMYVHHTHMPGRPCLSFQQCSADMRSMQRFHQDDRGWDDIGYSFVAGADGYIYEGRGWRWRGAHTLGHNSIGYGVSFIGDYATTLPSQHSMGLVRDQLASCAVSGGRLVANFILQGHRQVVDTSCPGEALYNEIRGWEHFGEVEE